MDQNDFPQRLKAFREELLALCKKYNIEVVSVINHMPSALISEIQFVDVLNDEMMKRYGLERVVDKSSSLLTN